MSNNNRSERELRNEYLKLDSTILRMFKKYAPSKSVRQMAYGILVSRRSK